MRIFDPGYDHQAIARFLRREARKGFQRGDDPATWAYVEACSIGVNLPEAPNSVSLILTRDANPDCLIGWHLSVCCVTHRGYRGYVPAEGEYWLNLILGPFADQAVMQPLADRTIQGSLKDVRHFIIECDWQETADPVLALGAE